MSHQWAHTEFAGNANRENLRRARLSVARGGCPSQEKCQITRGDERGTASQIQTSDSDHVCSRPQSGHRLQAVNALA
jgi:hypothetical protein